MQITHIAGVDLAANGWQLVADPMLAGNAGDNWQQTELGLLNDYPRPFQLTVQTQSPSRTTITQRVRNLLHALNARDYHHKPHLVLRLQITYNNVIYFVLFEPRNVQAGVLQWTGVQYVQSLTITGVLLYPPYRQVPQRFAISTISPLAAFNTVSYSFSANKLYWSPAEIGLFGPALGIFGGIWIGLNETGYPQSIIVTSIPNSMPSSTAISIGSLTARRMGAVGTYTYTMIWGDLGVTYDYWVHIDKPATITITSSGRTIAVVVTNNNQFCYYVGRFQNQIPVTITIATTAVDTTFYPIIASHAILSRCVMYNGGYSINVEEVIWGNSASTFGTPTRMVEANDQYAPLSGATVCLAPENGLIVATWKNVSSQVTGYLDRFAVEQGLL